MSYLTDKSSAPFDIFNSGALYTTSYSGTATALQNGFQGIVGDVSLDSLLGSKWLTEDGRTLTLVSNAATALVSGVLVQTQAETTAFEKLAVPALATQTAGNPPVAGSVGSYQIIVTNGATVIPQNALNGGYAIVAAGTGIGQMLRIASNNGVAANAAATITLEDPVQVALDNTSKVSLLYNPYRNVIIAPASETGAPVGATLYPVQASTAATTNVTSGVQTVAPQPQYFFVVSHGPASVLVDTVTNVGYPVGRSASVAGAVSVATLTTAAMVGVNMQTQTTAQNGLVYLYL